ncbi:MAG: hypothetical protein LLG20_25390 [Acidobacteriales bacterium]|nr:hypothetical protein [Terriglobales bacterium]
MRRYCLLILFLCAAPLAGGERTLYNGIQLPSVWPPHYEDVTAEPMPVPYLSAPPAIIPIDVGRQLFVDDFLIGSTTLTRTYHQAQYIAGNPVLKPDRPYEMPRGATSMVFSDGVWFDPKDNLFKMWYMAGYTSNVAYAVSKDGIHWDKPALDVRPGTNLVFEGYRDSTTVWFDQEEKGPMRRYKLFLVKRSPWAMELYYSPDGIHWSPRAATTTVRIGDRSTAFWNPFRRVWVYSIRAGNKRGRIRHYYENPDAATGLGWKAGQPVPWTGADRLDPTRADLKTATELYNLDAVAYESLLVGLFSIWRGQPKDRPKPNDIVAGYSRDGFHWSRPDRRPLVPVSEKKGDWNWGNVQSAGGCMLVVRDKLYFYVSGRAGVEGTSQSGVSTTGLATLRRDGFASMDAGGKESTLTTRLVRFSGEHLFVNAATRGGELRVELLDERDRVIVPYTRKNSMVLRGDVTISEMRWKSRKDLGSLVGKPVKFRFYLKNGRLYSFWVTSSPEGASHGYVAAGGPGFTGPTDAVGTAIYR